MDIDKNEEILSICDLIGDAVRGKPQRRVIEAFMTILVYSVAREMDDELRGKVVKKISENFADYVSAERYKFISLGDV